MVDTYFNHIPPEMLRMICAKMELEDIICLRDTNNRIQPVIDLMFFRSIHKIEVYWRSDGATITVSGPSLPDRYSISTRSFCYEEVLQLCKYTRALIITKEEDAKNYSILALLAKQAYQLTHLEIRLRKGKREVSPPTIAEAFQRLTKFVGRIRCKPSTFRLETDEDNFIEFKSNNGQVIMDFNQTYQGDICRSVVPLIQEVIRDNINMADVTIRLNVDKKLELTLQSAFHCIPHSQRRVINTLRLEFGPAIASLTHSDMEHVLSTFAPELKGARNLKHLKCILTESKLNPAGLEELYKLISSEMCGEEYRISLVLADIKEKTPTFKCSICKSVIRCK